MSKANKGIHCFLFSYNLSNELENCIRSIESSRLPLTIIDDGSRDEQTRLVLREAKKTYEVIERRDLVKEEAAPDKRTGGLYAGMNVAMQLAIERDLEYVLFIQDDMQLVRSLSTRDVNLFDKYFAEHDSIVLQSCFLKSAFRKHDDTRMQMANCKTCYMRREIGPGRFHFSAAGVFNVKAFSARYKEFEVGERNNETKSKGIGLSMGFYRFPFMTWLPYPRGRDINNKSFGNQVIARFGSAGFHRIEMMSDTSIERLFANDPKDLPFSEDYLTSRTAPRSDVWSPESGIMNMICRGGWRKIVGMVLNYLGVGVR
ncbi:MAG: glycosyltransferase family A protein [Pseudohongiellaceae bacterium]